MAGVLERASVCRAGNQKSDLWSSGSQVDLPSPPLTLGSLFLACLPGALGDAFSPPFLFCSMGSCYFPISPWLESVFIPRTQFLLEILCLSSARL